MASDSRADGGEALYLRTEHYTVLGILRNGIATVEEIAATLELPIAAAAPLGRTLARGTVAF